MKKLLLFLVLVLLAAPAWAGPAEIAGVYVKCPSKQEAACPQVAEEFRRLFPNNQNSPFLILRKDGRGNLAPDDLSTIEFTWQMQGDSMILMKMNDHKKSKVEFQIVGKQLVNPKTRETYLLSLDDAEWNPEPQPFKIKSKSLSGVQK